jgi:transposase-like protein
MAGKYGAIDPVGNDDNKSRVNMMELWNESIRRADVKKTTVTKTAQDTNEARADLEQRIRSGQEPCPTCAARTYKDASGDTSVSFQAPKHLSSATAGVSVMSHEHEHVSHEAADAREEGGAVTHSTVSLQYDTCPTCGKTYVAGGLTKTTTQTPIKSSSGGGFSNRLLDVKA